MTVFFWMSVEIFELIVPFAGLGEEAGLPFLNGVFEGESGRGDSGGFYDGGLEKFKLGFAVGEVIFDERSKIDVDVRDFFLEFEIVDWGFKFDAAGVQ